MGNYFLFSICVHQITLIRYFGQIFSIDIKMYLDTNVKIETPYTYYFFGTIIPAAVTGIYAYFNLEPNAYLGL